MEKKKTCRRSKKYCCDDLNQAPAMADHHHQRRPTDKSSASVAARAGARYPPKLIEESKAVIHEILAGLKEAPGVQGELICLLSGLGKHGGDADGVRARAADLLRGHPDLLRRFTEWIGLDSALAFVKRVHETAGPVVHDRFLAVLSETKRMAADDVYDRAKRVFGPAHVGLLHAFATLWLPGEEEWKLQQQARARRPARRQRSRAAAASSHAGMPDAKKPRADDDDGNARRHDPAMVRRQRSRAAAASSHAAAGMPCAKKKPRADDDGNSGRRHDHVIAELEVRNVKKRRRSDDDGTGRGRHALRVVGESSGDGASAAAAPARDDDYEYAPRSRRNKPRSGNGEFSGSAAEARVVGADAAGIHHHAYIHNDKKPPRRRAASGGKSSSAGAAGPERDGEVRRFRQEWEFQTCYSKLVATSDRVTELLRSPHGGGGGSNSSMEALFPLAECREFLHNYYGDRWGQMRVALERGESRVPALEAIARSLTAKEEEAVVEESRKRCRHDAVRVAQRLHGLTMDTLDEECRWHHGGGA